MSESRIYKIEGGEVTSKPLREPGCFADGLAIAVPRRMTPSTPDFVPGWVAPTVQRIAPWCTFYVVPKLVESEFDEDYRESVVLRWRGRAQMGGIACPGDGVAAACVGGNMGLAKIVFHELFHIVSPHLPVATIKKIYDHAERSHVTFCDAYADNLEERSARAFEGWSTYAEHMAPSKPLHCPVEAAFCHIYTGAFARELAASTRTKEPSFFQKIMGRLAA